jgi:hypothetical protein
LRSSGHHQLVKFGHIFTIGAFRKIDMNQNGDFTAAGLLALGAFGTFKEQTDTPKAQPAWAD